MGRLLGWLSVFGSLALCLSLALGDLPLGTGQEIPVVAYISNAEPKILGVEVLDESEEVTDSIDPASTFYAEVFVRDNNTLLDIEAIDLVLYSDQSTEQGADSAEDHYSFSWDGGVFVNEGGVGEIIAYRCETPGSMMSGQGIWRFAFRLERIARRSADWTMLVGVSDEANLTTSETSVEVTGFSSLELEESTITFSGQPGSVVASDQNPIQLSYISNQGIRLASWCTDFVGASQPSIVIGPSSFSLDDDPQHSESPETGVDRLTLAQTSRDFYGSLPAGTHTLTVYVFIEIPEPFLDQDYLGTLALEAYS